MYLFEIKFYTKLNYLKLSFGIELLETLTDQLNGTMTRLVEDGTHYIFEFPAQQIIGN